MNITHFVRKENSGLFMSTVELADYELKAGHDVTLRQPTEENGQPFYGNGDEPDVELVHSQLTVNSYFNDKPRFMWMHGEPLSSVGNKVSMKAIVDLASKMDAFICMRTDEHAIWNSIKRTYLVNKGIDLERFKPLEGVEKLAGEPSILYCENWRGQRNPLYLMVAMQQVWQKYPKARLHLVNCNDPKLYEMFKSLIDHNKWWTFTRTLTGRVPPDKMNELYNSADIVVSCLFPLYARSIEAFAAGKPLVCPGYRENAYPYECELDPDSIAQAIVNAWEHYDQFDARAWANTYHNIANTVDQTISIYKRYL